MANDIIEELLNLDMEPKPEPLWWTSTHKHEDMQTLRLESTGRILDLPFFEKFDANPSWDNVVGTEYANGCKECTVMHKQTRHNDSVLRKFIESLSNMVGDTLNATRLSFFFERA